MKKRAMEDAMKKRYVWQDVVNLYLGIWVLVTPGLNGHRLSAKLAANDVIVGILIAFFAGAALIVFRPWQESINMVLGAWLLVSPWVLGFQAVPSLMWGSVVIGVVVMFCSAVALANKRSPSR